MKKLLLCGLVLWGLSSASFAEEKVITYEYLEVGGSLLTPGGFNAMVGYSMDNLTLRGLGMGYTLINPNTSPPISLLFNIGVNYRFLKDEDR